MATTPSTPAESAKAQFLLELLTARGPMERAEISEITGWVRSTVSIHIGQMLKTGLLVESQATTRPGRGRPSSVVCVNPSAGAAIGIDFGFRHVRGVIADISHRPLQRYQLELGQDYSPDEGLDAAASVIKELIASSGVSAQRILGVGAAVPAPINPQTGAVSHSAMIPRWLGISVRDELQRRSTYPVKTDNESKLAAMAEHMWGAGQGYDPLVYLKLHSGVGGAVIVHGQLFHGNGGGAGEFGHMSLDPHGPLCRCGNRGCLEIYAGIPAILSALGSALGYVPTLQDAMRLYASGDPACRRVLAESALRIGQAIGLLCNALNPECVLIGGHLAGVGELFLEEIGRSARMVSLPMNRDVDITFGNLGKYASAMGAVALVLTSGFKFRRLSVAPRA